MHSGPLGARVLRVGVESLSVDEGGGLDATLRRLEALRYSSLMEARAGVGARSSEVLCVDPPPHAQTLCD